MTDDKREKLSALLDDELSADDMAETINQVQGLDSLLLTWQRYQLIGDLMRGETPVGSAGGVVDRVRAELKSEPAIIAFPQRKKVRSRLPRRWPRHLAGGVLAASVAAFSVIMLPRLTISTVDEPGPDRVASNPGVEPRLVRQTGTHWKNLSKRKVESTLNRYLMEHNEFASPGGMKGVLPYASFVTYDQNR